jgi:hypothetical protein
MGARPPTKPVSPCFRSNFHKYALAGPNRQAARATFTVTFGKSKVGVGIMVGVGVMVGVNVCVGVGVSVGVYVAVKVAVGLGVCVQTAAVAVCIVAVRLARASGEGSQAETRMKTRSNRNDLRGMVPGSLVIRRFELIHIGKCIEAVFLHDYTANLPISS